MTLDIKEQIAIMPPCAERKVSDERSQPMPQNAYL